MGGEGGNFEEKKPTNLHPKLKLCRKFHQSRTMAKWSKKIGENFRGGGISKEKNENMHNYIPE